MWLDDSQCVPLSTRWRVEFQENLARKDAEEKMKMEELKAKAKKELEDWWAWTMFCFPIIPKCTKWVSFGPGTKITKKRWRERKRRTGERFLNPPHMAFSDFGRKKGGREYLGPGPEWRAHDHNLWQKGRDGGRVPGPESFPWNCSHRRVAEQAFLEDVNGLKPGSEWDRVAKNCDFNSKVISKDHNVDVEVHFRFSLSNTSRECRVDLKYQSLTFKVSHNKKDRSRMKWVKLGFISQLQKYCFQLFLEDMFDLLFSSYKLIFLSGLWFCNWRRCPLWTGKKKCDFSSWTKYILPPKLECPPGICVIFLSIKKSFLAVIACGRRIYKQFDQQLLTQCPNSRHRSVRQPKNNIILEHRGRNTSPPK